MAIQSVNPATGEVLRVFEPHTPEEVEERLARAEAAFRAYRRTSFDERAGWMRRAAELLEAEREHLARLMTLEMGKPIAAARAEVAKCAWVCRHYAEHAAALLAEEHVAVEGARAGVRYQPLGPVLAIMPWNFPFWQVFRFAAPALMAGNVGLLKHASNVPQCALAIEELLLRAGFPEGVFQTLLVPSDRVAPILADPRVRAVTLTGSDAAGSHVAAAAGREIKKSVMELGGSDPFLVLPSADLEAAVATAVQARLVNNGQSCIAAKRFIVAEPIAEAFERRFVAAMEAVRIGDPMDPETQLGPLATEEILGRLEAQVRDSLAAGARALTGARRLERPGFFYAPTVLTDIPRESPAYRDELFGPVASLFRVRDLEEALRVANDTRFGLGASAWTRDTAEMERCLEEIEAGLVFINGMVASDPRLPFGGVKHSGYGRELGVHGLREFVNIKTVWIARGERPDGAATE